MFKCPVCGGQMLNCDCMYDFGQKKCAICKKSIDKVGLSWIIERDNPPHDSLCFCEKHTYIHPTVDYSLLYKLKLKLKTLTNR